MLAEDPNEWDDLYDDVPMEDDEKLPIAHVMVTGKRGRPPSGRILPGSFFREYSGRRTRGTIWF